MTTTAAAAGTRRHTGTYPAEPRQVGIARAALAGWLDGGPQDEAILVASEFATNSVLFFSFYFCFRVAIAAISGKGTCGLCCSITSFSLRFSPNHVRRVSLQQGRANCDTGTAEHGECGEKSCTVSPGTMARSPYAPKSVRIASGSRWRMPEAVA